MYIRARRKAPHRTRASLRMQITTWPLHCSPTVQGTSSCSQVRLLPAASWLPSCSSSVEQCLSKPLQRGTITASSDFPGCRKRDRLPTAPGMLAGCEQSHIHHRRGDGGQANPSAVVSGTSHGSRPRSRHAGSILVAGCWSRGDSSLQWEALETKPSFSRGWEASTELPATLTGCSIAALRDVA